MILNVDWQRLVTEDGGTCDRCGGTQAELSTALDILRTSLRPLGIEIAYVESELTPDEFAADMVQSNRILLGSRTLEDWLGAEVGQSDCESCCPGDAASGRTQVPCCPGSDPKKAAT